MNPSETVLVVDDDDDFRAVLQKLLEEDGHPTVCAASAEEAIGLLATQQPICVILDLGMPKVGGAELARRIREAHGNGVVLIVLTGSADEAEQDDAERAGVDYVLHKPLNMDRLRSILPRID